MNRNRLVLVAVMAAALLGGCGRRETAPPGSETPATPGVTPAASAASGG